MRTFERWLIFEQDDTPSCGGPSFTEQSAWHNFAAWMTGNCAVTPDEIARYQFIGYRAVRVTITVEDE
jgi:hypothetical protein